MDNYILENDRDQIPINTQETNEVTSASRFTDNVVSPLYSNVEGGSLELTEEVLEALKLFGHQSFRFGQEKAIMRILNGQSTLLVLSTGTGKSLCYQLPAYLYRKHKKCITLVISPLVSLMEDQIVNAPKFLKAACYHSNQTDKQHENILNLLKEDKIDLLLLSPETLVAGENTKGLTLLMPHLPPIAFACIDEIHCISQWSHNFRPSYLMLCRTLKEKLNVQTILGLTATATIVSRKSIQTLLDISDDGTISNIPVPNNLILTASKDANRDTSLIYLLKSENFQTCNSIVVYCTRRDDCERVAGLIRTSLQHSVQSSGSTKRKNTSQIAEAYHAGLSAYQRKSIQKKFLTGDLRIIVATIAFGMGINNPNIRAVIHYNMPKSFESYVQEIGRAGRDGKLSHCHVFLDPEGNDRFELQRQIYANSVDRHAIRKLLQKIFVPCSCR